MVMKSIPPKSGGELGNDLHWKPLGGRFWRIFCPSKFRRWIDGRVSFSFSMKGVKEAT